MFEFDRARPSLPGFSLLGKYGGHFLIVVAADLGERYALGRAAGSEADWCAGIRSQSRLFIEKLGGFRITGGFCHIADVVQGKSAAWIESVGSTEILIGVRPVVAVNRCHAARVQPGRSFFCSLGANSLRGQSGIFGSNLVNRFIAPLARKSNDHLLGRACSSSLPVILQCRIQIPLRLFGHSKIVESESVLWIFLQCLLQ